jgi:Polyketide cyclase / dehydrase and lipid transport
MALIRKEILIATSLVQAWAELSDWGALHERLAPGFAIDTRLDGADRIVTFFNGSVVREQLVDLDEETHRLVWSIVDGPYAEHLGSAQLFAEQGEKTRLVWISDLLPDELAAPTAAMMARGLGVIKATLEARAGQAPALSP